MQGWISIYRQITEHWVWKEKPFSQGQAWVDLLLMANYQDRKFALGDEIVTAEAGSIVTSQLKLMERWGWSKSKVRRFLKLLESDGMIHIKADRRKTTIFIVNWGNFQDLQTTEKPKKDHSQTTRRPLKDTNNNDNKENNDNKDIYCSNFESFWKVYPRKKEKAKAYKAYCARLKDGYSEEELMKAGTVYAQECSSRNTEEKYIKLGATFLGVNTPFIDYIAKEKKHDGNLQSRTSTSDFYRALLRECESDGSSKFE